MNIAVARVYQLSAHALTLELTLTLTLSMDTGRWEGVEAAPSYFPLHFSRHLRSAQF